MSKNILPMSLKDSKFLKESITTFRKQLKSNISNTCKHLRKRALHTHKKKTTKHFQQNVTGKLTYIRHHVLTTEMYFTARYSIHDNKPQHSRR